MDTIHTDIYGVIQARISELEQIITNTPIQKSFTAQSRLVEAKYILELLQNKLAQTEE